MIISDNSRIIRATSNPVRGNILPKKDKGRSSNFILQKHMQSGVCNPLDNGTLQKGNMLLAFNIT
jgi:hypothetical protein